MKSLIHVFAEPEFNIYSSFISGKFFTVNFKIKNEAVKKKWQKLKFLKYFFFSFCHLLLFFTTKFFHNQFTLT